MQLLGSAGEGLNPQPPPLASMRLVCGALNLKKKFFSVSQNYIEMLSQKSWRPTSDDNAQLPMYI